MLIKSCLFVGLFLLVSVRAQIDLDFCNPAEIVVDPLNLDVPLPDVYAQFDQLVEVNYNGATEEFVEVYDGLRNVGVTARKNATNAVTYMVNGNLNEVLEFRPNYECRVYKLDEFDSSLDGYFPIKFPNGTIHIVFGLTALIASGSLKLVYIGSNQDIRGIPVNEWQGCLYVPGDKSTSRITVSYSDPKKWTPAAFSEDDKTIPVQISIETKRQGSPEIEIGVASIARYKPYINFKSRTTEDYLTPSGYFCPGRKNTKNLPDIPRAFSLYNQISQPVPDTKDLIGISYNFREEYDYNNKLFRYDTVNVTEVHDFSTGLNYIVDKRSGLCTIAELNVGIDSQTTTAEGATVLEMRNPAAFFDAEGAEYHYVGVKMADGIACDVWIGKKTTDGKDQIFEWYFMADSWSSPFQAGQNTGLPVLTIVYTPNVPNPLDQTKLTTIKTYNNFFIFSDTLVNVLDFELDRCNRGLDRQGFIFTMPISAAPSIMEHRGLFLQATIQALQKVARVVLLRVAHTTFSFGPNHVFVTFTIYDRSLKYGNVVTPTDDVSLDDAIKNLVTYFSRNPLKISFPTGPTTTVTLYSDPVLKLTSSSGLDAYLVVDIKEYDKGFSTGAVVCVVLMGIFVGVSTGFLLIILHKNKKINLPFLRLFYRD